MSKFHKPLNGKLWITQTYHTFAGNTAVDFSAVAETPVYALGDGRVTYRSAGAGSYCIQTLDNSDIKVYYVHTYKWVAANTRVTRGQVIARVAPQTHNGGYPTHLHLGLQAGKLLMDYMARDLDYDTRFKAIADIWFKNGKIDWTKHKDLSYLKTPPAPPVDPCKTQKAEIVTLKNELVRKNDLIKFTSNSLIDKEAEIGKLEKELEDAKSSEAFAYGEVKKVKNKLESASLNISTQNDIIKNLEADILLFETKVDGITKKITELLGIRSKYELEKEKNRKIQEKLDRGIERLTLGELIRGILYKLRV